MGTLEKRLVETGKCKPIELRHTWKTNPPAEPWPVTIDLNETAALVYERPWHAEFLKTALKTADVPAALKQHDIGWGDYTRSRRDHPTFSAACTELDLVVRQALLIRLEAQAAAGDTKALKLLAGGLDVLRAQVEDAGIGAPIAPHWLDRVPLVRFGRAVLPQGPCSTCADGLVIALSHPQTGQRQVVVVRNSDLENRTAAGTESKVFREASRLGAYFDAEIDGPEVPIVYGWPLRRDAEGVIRIAEHHLDYGVHPSHVVPAPTGPYAAEIEAIKRTREEATEARRKQGLAQWPTPEQEAEREWASYLPAEVDREGWRQIPFDHRDKYDAGLIGQGPTERHGYKIKPQYRETLAKHQPMAK